MKTISDLTTLIADHEKSWDIPQSELLLIEQKFIDKGIAHVKFLRQCKMAVERGVTEVSLKRQLETLNAQVKVVDEGFEAWLGRADNSDKKKSIKVMKTAYYKEMKVSDIENQIKTINFLLT